MNQTNQVLTQPDGSVFTIVDSESNNITKAVVETANSPEFRAALRDEIDQEIIDKLKRIAENHGCGMNLRPPKNLK